MDPGGEGGTLLASSGWDLHLGAHTLRPGPAWSYGHCSHPCSPLSETQHLLSRIRTYSPLGRHPDKSYKFYILLGFSVFSLLLRHPKLPYLQPSSCYLFQDDGLADISYSSSPLMPLKKILGRPGPPKSKPHLKMLLPQTHSFKRYVLVFSCFPGAWKKQA